MGAKSSRLNITLPPEHAAKLARLADRAHVQEGTLARSLLVHAIDETDVDPRHVVEVLDSIAGAWDRIDQGLEDARSGRTIALDEL